jgi:DsbC/DsbD-like thiol-disulfide interchange protein
MAGSRHGASVQGGAQGMQVVARLDGSTSPESPPTCLAVDLTIDPGLHVYGHPIPEGFIPLSIDVAPLTGLHIGTPVFPPPTPHQMEGFDEAFFIYEGALSVSIPLTFIAEVDATALEVKVRYQACSDRGCFMPQTVELSLPVRELNS